MTGKTLGRYRVVKKIGDGGMADAYRARDTKLGRDVALKILSEAFASDEQRMARFEREAQVLASLNHPNIASIYGLEEEAGIRWLVAELVEGQTLAERMREGSIPLEETLYIARRIADALETAHKRGIIHRDLKPENVMVDQNGSVKVMDFGFARSVETGTTSNGAFIDTPAYMAPEQAEGKPVDRRTDIYSFGVVLYEMLTGNKPFMSETVPVSLAAALRAEVDLKALPTATPLRIHKILRLCLKRNPADRLDNIAVAQRELEITAVQTHLLKTRVAYAPTRVSWLRPLVEIDYSALGKTLARVVLPFALGAVVAFRAPYFLPFGDNLHSGLSLVFRIEITGLTIVSMLEITSRLARKHTKRDEQDIA